MEFQQLEFIKHLWHFKRAVYLDHNATTCVSRHVRRTMEHVLKCCYGNPSSLYRTGRKSAEILQTARRQVADAIHAGTHEVFFTGCATESNNAVLKSVTDYYWPKKKKIISTPIEHPSVINTLEFLKTQGITVEYCPVDHRGRVEPAALEKIVDGQTFLICCMLANNEIGTIQDIPAVVRIARKYKIHVLSDCVQAFGKIPVDVHSLGIDYASFSAHKLYGPKGAGVLYIKQGSPFSAFIHGGHQEAGRRAGTESLHNIAGFGAACRDVDTLPAATAKIRILKDRLIRGLKEIKPDCVINSPENDCLPNTISVTLPGINNAGMMSLLDYYGIAVSAGSACSTQEDKPSHVLKAIGLSDRAAQETIRISLGCRTSARDIRYTTRVFRKIIEGKSLFVNMITPAQLNRTVLFDDNTYILDVRPQYARKKLQSLPNAHEVSFMSLEKYVNQLPKDKHILVACQRGNLSFIVAYYLKSKGFKQVSNLRAGVAGWSVRRGDLYQQYAGQNITVLEPER